MKAFKALLLIPLIPVVIILAGIDFVANPDRGSSPSIDRLLNYILS